MVISIETTRRQAKEFGWPWQELFDFFLIHGILHLMGYDHGAPGEEEAMTAKTWELMKLLHPKIVVSSQYLIVVSASHRADPGQTTGPVLTWLLKGEPACLDWK